MKFTKMHGCGNDYIYINAFETPLPAPEDMTRLAQSLSDRRKGIGSDGVIWIAPPPDSTADGTMVMFNADGSRAAMCGNGIRCVAKFLCDSGITGNKTLRIATDSGLKTAEITHETPAISMVRVNMGAAQFLPNPLPRYDLHCVSMGNPHAVMFVEDVAAAPVQTLGPVIEQDAAFPDRVNIEFVRMRSRSEMDYRVWERGSGETLACGTGACAAVAVSHKLGLSEDKVTVHLAGGDLHIHVDAVQNTIWMTGEAVTVYEGEIAL